jgi:hypothetical protein
MKQNRVYAAIIFCVSFLLYAKTIGFDYSYFDDNDMLLDNQSYFEGKTDIKRIFTTDAFLAKSTSYYRPLQTLSYLADVIISGGLNTWMFHLTNIILFGIIGCLLFFMLLKFNISIKVALVGTLIFCVHPLFVTAVAWIPARGDLLLTIFCMLSFMFFKEFTETVKIKYLLLVWLTFTIALFCKETAVFLPFVLLTYFIFVTPNQKINKNYILLGLLMVLSGFIWLYLRVLCKLSMPMVPININFFLANFLTIPVAFSQLFLFPVDFSPLPNFTTTKLVVGLLSLVFVFFLVFKKTKRPFRENLFYILWFFLFLFPNFLGVKIDNIDYIDHRFLLPIIGILLFVLSVFPASTKGEDEISIFKGKDFIWIGTVIVLGIVSFIKTDVYKNPESYYGETINHNPENALAYHNRGRWKHKIIHCTC